MTTTTVGVGRQSSPARFVMTLAGGVGLGLFAWSIERAGPAAVMSGIRSVGPGIIVICALGGLRGLIRAAAWRFCLDPKDRVSFASTYAAYLVGDAIGNLTPFGMLLSEPSKILLLRHRIDMAAAAAALVIENVVYSGTVAAMLFAGTATLLLVFQVSEPVRIAGIATLIVVPVCVLLVVWILWTRRRVMTGTVEWLIRRNIAAAFWKRRLPRVREVGDLILGFSSRR